MSTSDNRPQVHEPASPPPVTVAVPDSRDLHRAVPVGLLLVAGLAALVVSLWWATASRAGAQQPAPGAIEVIDFDYVQRDVTVPAGTSVTWTNTGDHPHTATDRGGTFDTQPLLNGESGSIKLDTPGTYFYFCRINPVKMNGTITVTPTAAKPPAVRVQMVDGTNIEGETFRFDPPTFEVPAGTQLLVANVGGKPHSLTAEDGTFNTGILKPGPENGRFAGTNATITLDKPGTYPFFCEIHPTQMQGTVTVTGTAPPSTAAATAPPPSTSAPPAAAPSTGEVSMVDFAFTPSQLSVGPEAQVTFRNGDSAPHTATFVDVDLDTGTLDTGASGTLTAPAQPGSYSYFCSIHPSMRGVLVVLGADTPDPAALASATTASATTASATTASGTGTSAAAGAAATTQLAAAAADAGSGGLMQGWVLITAAIGCVLGGIGLASLLNRRRSAS